MLTRTKIMLSMVLPLVGMNAGGYHDTTADDRS
jgi:hypothetical protein